MQEYTKAAQVNTSYTIFFFLAAMGLAFFFSGSFGDLQSKSWFIILGYALLVYFFWDFIKQLYSPGQSIILYFLAFILLPFVFSLTLGNKFPIAGMLIWLGSMLVAGILELIYEFVFKAIAPKGIVKRLLLVDGEIDKSMVSLNRRYQSSFNVTGVVLASLLILAYYVLSYILIVKT